MSAWRPHHAAPAAHQLQPLSRKIQALIREARCYPPENEDRIVVDMRDCCHYFTGLKPRLEAVSLDSSGKTGRMVVLDGVIPITYRGNMYQIPVMICCRPHYPEEAPVPFVRPTASMVIRDRHSNVDRTGRVHLQHYLSIWDPNQFSLYGLVLAMMRVFSVEPPVNSRPAAAAEVAAAISTIRPPPTPPSRLPQLPSSTPPSMQSPPASHTAATAKAQTAEAARRELITRLSKGLGQRMNAVSNDAVQELGELMERRHRAVERSKKAHAALRETEERERKLRESCERLSVRRKGLREWVDAMDEATRTNEHGNDIDNENQGPGQAEQRERPVDETLQYRDVLLHQIAENMAKDHAYTDTLDQVDEAFVKGVIDHDGYVREVRNLSREQFFPRALSKALEAAAKRRNAAPSSPSNAPMSSRADATPASQQFAV